MAIGMMYSPAFARLRMLPRMPTGITSTMPSRIVRASRRSPAVACFSPRIIRTKSAVASTHPPTVHAASSPSA
jgi:hypothetical protein